MLFLVSGASGVGKSTVRASVAPRLGSAFDAIELRDLAPTDAVSVRWRQETAHIAAERAVGGRHVLLCGDPVAPAEIVAAPAATDTGGVAVCLLDADPETQTARLRGRGDDLALLEAHHGFAQWMREHARDPLPRSEVVTEPGSPDSRWERVRRLVAEDRWRVTVIDTSGRGPAEVGDAVEAWIRAALVDDALVMHPSDPAPTSSMTS